MRHNDTTKMFTASKHKSVSPSRVVGRDEDLFDRDDDDIFHGNDRFGAIVDDYKRVINRRPKHNDEDLTVKPKQKSKHSGGSIGRIAPIDDETELSIKELEDNSEGTKVSPIVDRIMQLSELQPADKKTFIETEMSYRDKQDDDRCIAEKRNQ